MRQISMSILFCSLLFWYGCQSEPQQSEATPPENVDPTQKVESAATLEEQDPATSESHSNVSKTAPLQPKRVVRSTPAPVLNKSMSPESKPALPASRKYVIPAETELPVRLIDAISTETNQAGDTFLASLAEPLALNGTTLFPKDTSVKGKIITLEEPGRVSGVASLSLQLTEILPKGGSSISLETEPFSQTAKAGKKKDAAIIGGGSAIGTAIGAIAGGKKGAAIGAITGGAGSTGYVLATKGRQLEFPSETLITFKLAEPLAITR